MRKKLLLIVNPVAGTRMSRTAVFDVLSRFCGAGMRVTIELTQFRGHARELAAAAERDGFDLVVCCGGDGTLNEVLSGLISSGSKLPVGYIPAGSTNDFAQTLGLPTNPSEAAYRVCEGRVMPLDFGRFGDDSYFSYIASFGAFTAASYSAPQDLKNVLGHLAYVIEGIKELSSITAYDVKCSSGDRDYSGRYIFGSVSNTSSVGGIVKLPEGSYDLSDGLFEVILVKEPRNLDDLNKVLTGAMSGDFTLDCFECFKSSELCFSIEGAAWSLDGEKAVPDGPVKITNLKHAVTLLY